MEWFRWYHNTAADSKLAIISKRSGRHKCVVLSCWSIFLEYASSRKDRGSLVGIDHEEVAVALDIEMDDVKDIYQTMVDKGMIQNDRLSNWEKRQPKREDEHSYERLKKHREKQKTMHDNASETHDNANDAHVTCKNITEHNRININTTTRTKALRPPSGDHQLFLAWWSMAFEKVTGHKPTINGKAGSQVKEMLKNVPSVTALVAYAATVLTSDDDFYSKAGRTLGVLQAQLDGFKSKKVVYDMDTWRDMGLVPSEGVKFVDWKFWEAPNETTV